jgi:hypothetical protein
VPEALGPRAVVGARLPRSGGRVAGAARASGAPSRSRGAMGRAPPELQGARARWARGEGGAVGAQRRRREAGAQRRGRVRMGGVAAREDGGGLRRRCGDGGRAGGGAKKDCRVRERNCVLRPINGPLFSSASVRPTKIMVS